MTISTGSDKDAQDSVEGRKKWHITEDVLVSFGSNNFSENFPAELRKKIRKMAGWYGDWVKV